MVRRRGDLVPSAVAAGTLTVPEAGQEVAHAPKEDLGIGSAPHGADLGDPRPSRREPRGFL